MIADEVTEKYGQVSVGLNIRLLEKETENESPMILIEGSKQALEMLAELLVAVSQDQRDDGFSISPFGAGSHHFAPTATLGLYIHRLDNTV